MADTNTSQYLVIDNVQMPNLKEDGLTITKEKVWSKNTGRGASGYLIGDIVTVKYKLQCEWGSLTRDEAALIDIAASKKFMTIQFLDPGTKTFITKTMYAGTPTYPVHSYAEGSKVKTYKGVKVDFIER